MRKTFICADCGKEVTEYPATRRSDSTTEICSACGTAEALTDWGKSKRKMSKAGITPDTKEVLMMVDGIGSCKEDRDFIRGHPLYMTCDAATNREISLLAMLFSHRSMIKEARKIVIEFN